MKKFVLSWLLLVTSLVFADSIVVRDSALSDNNGNSVLLKADNNGDGTYSLKSTIGALKDSSGNEAFNTIFGELTVGERTDNINVQFQYNNGKDVDTLITQTGTGSTTNADSMAEIRSGTGVGSAKIRSRDTNRYVTGHECISMFTSIHPTPETNTFSRHVYGDDNDFVGFGYNDLVFGIWVNFDGVINHIPLSEWNGNIPKDYNLNPQTLNIYSVSFGWLGIAPIQFKIYGGINFGWITVHTIDTPNSQTKPHYSRSWASKW